jgi:hypothetical protein
VSLLTLRGTLFTMRRFLALVTLATLGLAAPAAAGPPADGSVGRADDKAPKGQSAGDHNRGYECDDNPGVGNGNPAHTGTCDIIIDL